MDAEVNKTEFSQISEWFFRWRYRWPMMELFRAIAMIHSRQPHHELAIGTLFYRQSHYEYHKCNKNNENENQTKWKWLVQLVVELPKNNRCMFWHWKVSVSGDTFFAWCMRQLPVLKQCLQQKTSIINLIAENRRIQEIIRTILKSSSRRSRIPKAHILLNRIQLQHVQAILVQPTPMHRSNQHPRLYQGQ